MVWWLWVLGGIGLLAFEMATPGGLFLLFFGVGALLTAPLAAVGLPEPLQWLAFSVLSLAGLATLRGRLLRRLEQKPGAPEAIGNELVGEQAVLLTDVPAGGEGRAELRGTPWTVKVASGIPLEQGRRCRVERVDGLTLWLRAE